MTGAVTRALRESPLPVVASIRGVAAGAGTVLALASDFRLFARSASVAFLFTRVGLAGADMGSAYLLPRIVGLGHATRLLFLGDKLTAEKAHSLGLGELVEDDELDEATDTLARRLAEGPHFAFAATKSALTRELDMDLAGAIELDAVTQALLMQSEDFREFYAAWNEGRKPSWSGR
jgi:enoyl-CoA hydratase/carnithine racemase